MSSNVNRKIHELIADWIEPGSSVLELGCGDGELLELLVALHRARAQGVESDFGAISPCIEKGLNVIHEEIDEALADYGDGAFDYTIFDHSLQKVVKKPDLVLEQALRISRNSIVGFSNFTHLGARSQIFFQGRTPVTGVLPFEWYDTPNLHFLSIKDFQDYCARRKINIERTAFFGSRGQSVILPNLFALSGYFLISRTVGGRHQNTH